MSYIWGQLRPTIPGSRRCTGGKGATERALNEARRAVAALTRPMNEGLARTLAQVAEEVAARYGCGWSVRWLHRCTQMPISVSSWCRSSQVVADVATATDAVRQTLRVRPDVCLLDIRMPVDGIKATKEISAALPDTVVVMLTASTTMMMMCSRR